jgi:glycosyltransferase involved in cell wall biosynthesis
MRIGIDARELCGHATGVGRYLSGLLRQWADDARGHQIALYAHRPLADLPSAPYVSSRVIPGSGGTWWEQMDVPRAVRGDALDVWFAPGYTAPLRLAAPFVVAIHDLSFVAHPEWFRFREGARRRWLTSRAASQATAVVTISQFSKRELMDRLDIAEAKIHVIAPGTGAGGLGLGASCPSDGKPLAPSPKTLFVGSIFNRRHVPDLIRAFAPIARAHADASLDIVGDDRSYPREDLQAVIDGEQIGSQVTWHRWVTDDQLHDLYRQARAFAFLSEYEGLGLTPLEALARGVPPLLLDTPVARESCGSAALYAGLGDRRGTTAALERLLFDDTTRMRLLASAPHELAKFDWRRAAGATLDVLERAAGASR